VSSGGGQLNKILHKDKKQFETPQKFSMMIGNNMHIAENPPSTPALCKIMLHYGAAVCTKGKQDLLLRDDVYHSIFTTCSL